MRDEVTRRHLLKLGLGGALAAGTVSGASCYWSSPDEGAELSPRTTGWVHERQLVRRGDPDDPAEVILFPTLMRVGDKINDYRDEWYLWHWTHDAHVCRLYTAPKPTGPFRERSCSIPLPPAGYRVFSAGDVVWEAPYFYTTPHAHRPDDHDTFLLRSRDGQIWDYVTREPVLQTGPAGAFDAFAADYARFLRDFDGNIVRRNGEAVLYYRGQSGPAREGDEYAIGGATSSDFVNWTKLNAGEPLFKPPARLFAIGTALWEVNERTVNLILSTTTENFSRWTIELKRADTSESLDDWSNGPGVPLYSSSLQFVEGGSLIVADEVQYLALGTQRRPDTSMTIDLLESRPSS